MEDGSPKEIHFLVVDDDPDSRATVCDYLRGMGYLKISEATNGVEAVQLLDREPTINFIISDWDMPTLNGLDLLQKVKGSVSRGHLPFIIMTSPISQEAEKVISAAENLVDAYLIKPFRITALKEKLETVLSAPVRGKVRRALVVDDDPDSRETLSDYLKQMGFKDLVAFDNGRDALSYLKANATEVAIVVSDWEMPDMSGIELLRSCKALPALAQIPFVMVTSQSSIERMKVLQAARANVDQYLLKPFQSLEFKTRIEQALDRARSKNLVQAILGEALQHVEYHRYERAQARFEEVLKLDPTQDIALIGLGEVLMKIKSVDEAIPYFRRAVDVAPLNPKGYIRLAVAFEQLGWIEKAVAVLESGNQHISFNPDLHFHLGRMYLKKNDPTLARLEFEKTLQIQLDHQEARLMLDMILGTSRSGG